MAAWLTQGALRRVMQSLISATRRAQTARPSIPAGPWPDNFVLGEGEGTCLGCDSLDLLQVATAVNEMFHLHEAQLETELLQATSFGAWLALVQEAWERGVQQVTVTTSGSSGQPKFCPHEMGALVLEIDYLASLFGAAQRVVAFTPAHHLYGLLFTAMLPDRLGVPVWDFQSSASLQVPGQEKDAGLRAGDLLVSFPEGWRWIDRNVRSMPAGVEGVVSTAPCPPDLVAALGGRLKSFTEVYGSSETGGIGTRRWPAEAYTLMPQWQLSSSSLPGAKSELEHLSGAVVEPMDHLGFRSSRTFLLNGRKDQGVQVGGMNVFPVRVAERLKTYAGVADATVRLMRPDEGQRLKCFVVPEEGQSREELETGLRSWIESWPSTAERPKAISFGSSLPCNAVGKLSDW